MMQKILKILPIYLALMLWFGFSAPGWTAPAAFPAPTYDPRIAAAITGITTATLHTTISELSGEQPTHIGGAQYTLATRYTCNAEAVNQATQYAYERFQAFGYATVYHTYTIRCNGAAVTRRNVIAEKPGRRAPEQIVLLIAHLDSRAATWPHNPAPGADDNASGAAAVLAAAKELAGLDFAYTMRFALFTGEEQGMVGSNAYAQKVAAAGETIIGVINLDMIAWDAKNDPDLDLHTHNPTEADASDALAYFFANMIKVYDLALLPQVLEDGTRSSDHSRFWDQGYPAILVIEDYLNPDELAGEPRDWNPNYHTVNDLLATLNLVYCREVARAAAATIAALAEPLASLSRSYLYLPLIIGH